MPGQAHEAAVASPSPSECCAWPRYCLTWSIVPHRPNSPRWSVRPHGPPRTADIAIATTATAAASTAHVDAATLALPLSGGADV